MTYMDITENRDAGKYVLSQHMVGKILPVRPGQKIELSYVTEGSWSG